MAASLVRLCSPEEALGRGSSALPLSPVLLWTLDGSSSAEHVWEKQALLGVSAAALRLLPSG